MYTLNMPVSAIRTKMRQEFERHRYVSKLRTVDFLIYKSHAEFQVRRPWETHETQDEDSQGEDLTRHLQETLNFWKQVTHVLKYFRAEEDPKARLPKTFIDGFLEVSLSTAQFPHLRPKPWFTTRNKHSVRLANSFFFPIPTGP